MSRKRDPIQAVVDYFENADPVLIPQGVAVVLAIAKRRVPKSAPPRPRPKVKPRDAEGNLALN